MIPLQKNQRFSAVFFPSIDAIDDTPNSALPPAMCEVSLAHGVPLQTGMLFREIDSFLTCIYVLVSAHLLAMQFLNRQHNKLMAKYVDQ